MSQRIGLKIHLLCGLSRGRLTNQILLIFSSGRGWSEQEHFQNFICGRAQKEGAWTAKLSPIDKISFDSKKMARHTNFEFAATAAKSSQPPIYQSCCEKCRYLLLLP